MMQESRPVPDGQTPASSNHLLDRVPPDGLKHLMKRLEPVRFEPGQVLWQPGQPLTYVP
ncbi:MAG TPA: hypothetical protein VF592_06530 [Sphingomonas sp.]|jgi:hypothetical protein|uniref:hypothetical protein n=1 Tax=Sphingomonas sp. TaxID=28214 RepID=UPI002ED9C411